MADMIVTIRLRSELTLWDAVKLRIAGAEAVKRLLDVLCEEREIPPDDRT
jgi:hypothetical protein